MVDDLIDGVLGTLVGQMRLAVVVLFHIPHRVALEDCVSVLGEDVRERGADDIVASPPLAVEGDAGVTRPRVEIPRLPRVTPLGLVEKPCSKVPSTRGPLTLGVDL